VTGQGKPLRFLALVAVGWVGTRVVLLWPQAHSLPEAIKALSPFPLPSAHASPAGAWAFVRVAGPIRNAKMRPAAFPQPAPHALASAHVLDPPPRLHLVARTSAATSVVAAQLAPSVLAPGAGSDRLGPGRSRWSASAWLSVRPGRGIGAAPGGGQIGGSQAGVRLVYQLDPAARLAAFGRLAGPLRGRGREAALGLEWQPMRVPVRLVVERRLGLDGTPGGSGLGVIAGYDGALAGFQLETYGQAGAVWRTRVEPYADGAVRVSLPVAEDGGVRVALGLGAWGAAQREAQRLDLGPSVTLAVPVDRASLRLALDWRQRVAGTARPGSGPALTVGADF
jgi:hypothetical protein